MEQPPDPGDGEAIEPESSTATPTTWSNKSLEEIAITEHRVGMMMTARTHHVLDPLASAGDELVFTQTEVGKARQKAVGKETRTRKTVSKEVLAMLANVAQELNDAQAELEVRRQLKLRRHNKEHSAEDEETFMVDSEAIQDMVFGDMPQEVQDALEKLGAVPAGGDTHKVPHVLARKKPEQRWSHFKTVGWLNPNPKLEKPSWGAKTSELDDEDELSPSAAVKVATGKVITKYIQEGRESWQSLMQQRKREAYMEMLSGLLAANWKSANEKLAARTIQRAWRTKCQARRVQAVEALKALQADLRALMRAPGMPSAWAKEDQERQKEQRTEVVVERCVGPPPKADSDGEWEEELDENGYMRSDSTKVWKRSVMRVITYTPPEPDTPPEPISDDESDHLLAEPSNLRVSFYGKPEDGKPARRRRRHPKQADTGRGLLASESSMARYSMNGRYSVSGRVSVAGAEGLSIMPMGEMGGALGPQSSRLRVAAGRLQPEASGTACALGSRSKTLLAAAASGKLESGKASEGESEEEESGSDSDASSSSDGSGSSGSSGSGSYGGGGKGSRRHSRKDSKKSRKNSKLKPKHGKALAFLYKGQAGGTSVHRRDQADKGRPAWGRPAGPKVDLEEDRWKSKKKVVVSAPKMHLHSLERAARRVRTDTVVKVRDRISAAAAAAAARFAHVQARMAALAAKSAPVVVRQPEHESFGARHHGAAAGALAAAHAHGLGATHSSMREHDDHEPHGGASAFITNDPALEGAGGEDLYGHGFGQGGLSSLTGHGLGARGYGGPGGINPGTRSGSVEPGRHPGVGGAGLGAPGGGPEGDEAPLLALATMLANPALRKSLKGMGRLVRGLARDVDMAAAAAEQFLDQYHGTQASGTAAGRGAGQDGQEQEDWGLTGRVLIKRSPTEALRAKYAAKAEEKAAARAAAGMPGRKSGGSGAASGSGDVSAVDALLMRRGPQPGMDGLLGSGVGMKAAAPAQAIQPPARTASEKPPAPPAGRPLARFIRGALPPPPPDLTIGASTSAGAGPGIRIPPTVRAAASGSRVRSLVAVRRQARQQEQAYRQQQLQDLTQGLSSAAGFVTISRKVVKPQAPLSQALGQEDVPGAQEHSQGLPGASLKLMVPLTQPKAPQQAPKLAHPPRQRVAPSPPDPQAIASLGPCAIPLAHTLGRAPASQAPGGPSDSCDSAPQRRDKARGFTSPKFAINGPVPPLHAKPADAPPGPSKAMSNKQSATTTMDSSPDTASRASSADLSPLAAATAGYPHAAAGAVPRASMPAAVAGRSSSPVRGRISSPDRLMRTRRSSSSYQGLPCQPEDVPAAGAGARAALGPMTLSAASYPAQALDPGAGAQVQRSGGSLGPVGMMMQLGALGGVTGSAMRTHGSDAAGAAAGARQHTHGASYADVRGGDAPPPLSISPFHQHPAAAAYPPAPYPQPPSHPHHARPARRSSVELLGGLVTPITPDGPPLAVTGRLGRARRSSMESPAVGLVAEPAVTAPRPPRSRRSSIGPSVLASCGADFMISRSHSSVPHLPHLQGLGGGASPSPAGPEWLNSKLSEYVAQSQGSGPRWAERPMLVSPEPAVGAHAGVPPVAYQPHALHAQHPHSAGGVYAGEQGERPKGILASLLPPLNFGPLSFTSKKTAPNPASSQGPRS